MFASARRRLPRAPQGVPGPARRPRGGPRPPPAACRSATTERAYLARGPRGGRACCPAPAALARRRRSLIAHPRPSHRRKRHGHGARGRPDHRRRRVRWRRRPPARPGRVQGRMPRAGRVARPRRLSGQQARLGAQGPQGLGDQPEHPRARGGLPDRRGRHARSRRSCTTPSAAPRSSSRAPGRGPCRPTSGSARSTASPTTGRSTTSSSCRTSTGPTASSACPACPGDPAYPPDTEDAPMPPLPIGSAGLKVARAQTKLGWHWWPEFNSINSTPYDGRRPCVQRSTCQSGLQRGRQGVDRPDPLAEGDRPRRAAGHRRAGPPHRDRRAGPGDRRDLDRRGRRRALRARQGRRRRGQRDRHAAAAAELGRARRTRTGWRTRPGSSGSG